MKKYKKLEEIRKSKKVTLQSLADSAGVTKQYMWDLEKGRRVLSYYMAYKIAIHLGTTPDELFLEDSKKKR